MKPAHRIRLLGREIQVRSNAPEEDVQEVETFVNQKLAEVAIKLPSADQQLVSLLTLLNVSESYLALRKGAPAEETLSSGAVERLLKKLDMALE